MLTLKSWVIIFVIFLTSHHSIKWYDNCISLLQSAWLNVSQIILEDMVLRFICSHFIVLVLIHIYVTIFPYALWNLFQLVYIYGVEEIPGFIFQSFSSVLLSVFLSDYILPLSLSPSRTYLLSLSLSPSRTYPLCLFSRLFFSLTQRLFNLPSKTRTSIFSPSDIVYCISIGLFFKLLCMTQQFLFLDKIWNSYYKL